MLLLAEFEIADVVVVTVASSFNRFCCIGFVDGDDDDDNKKFVKFVDDVVAKEEEEQINDDDEEEQERYSSNSPPREDADEDGEKLLLDFFNALRLTALGAKITSRPLISSCGSSLAF